MNTDKQRINDGGSAFTYSTAEGYTNEGMSLRAYIATKAMAALIAKSPFLDREGALGKGQTQDEINTFVAEICHSATRYADALILELSKP